MVRDRGQATFFHGREQEIQAFQKAQVDARASNGGTIFLIQDAPSARLRPAGGRGGRALRNEEHASPGGGMEGWDCRRRFALFRRGAEGMSSEYAGRALHKVSEAAATPNGLVLDEVQTLRTLHGRQCQLTLRSPRINKGKEHVVSV